MTKHLFLIATLVAGMMTTHANPSSVAQAGTVAPNSDSPAVEKAAGELVGRNQSTDGNNQRGPGLPGVSDAGPTEPNTEASSGDIEPDRCPIPTPGTSTLSWPADRVAASEEQRSKDERYPEQVKADHPADCPCGKDCKCPPFVCKNKDCDKNYVILFTAKWCKPCRKMYPKIEQMRKDGYLVYVFDIDEHAALKEQFKLETVPTIVVMNKRKEVKRFVGITEVADITKFVVKEADQKPDSNPADKYKFLP